jgi:gamma-glutamyltranspeptidase/glutathione hydrolase
MILVTFHLVVQNIYTLSTKLKKLVFEDRAKYYADMNFVKVPVQQLFQRNMAKEELIDLDKSGTYQAGKATGTVYMTVADKEGNMFL